ncbi:MAG: histone deacetylase [Flavobacteriaceae bacterium]
MTSLIPVAFDPSYRLPLDKNHRFPMEKYELLPQQLLLEGTCEAADFFVPKPVKMNQVLRVHSKEYVDRLCNLELSKNEIRSIGFPLSEDLIKREFLIAGGTIMGAEKALDCGIAMNIAGGTHHAFPSRGEAFCLLNDQAIGAQHLLDKGYAKKILILDLDVHQGNGTASIFKNNKDVFTCSVHGAKNYPFRKEVSDYDVSMEDNCSDSVYIEEIQSLLHKLYDKIVPDFIFYLCGVDILESDKLGRLGMSMTGCKKRDELVLSFCKEKEIPVQCSMGGGYSKDLRVIIEAHANTFRVAKTLFT